MTYRFTLGAQGNLPRNTTFTIKPQNPIGVVEVAVDETFKLVRDGVDRVDLAEMRDQVFDILKPRWRTVTASDFQEVITTAQHDVINVTPIAAQDLTGPMPDRYQPGHVSVLLTPGARYELTQPSRIFNADQLVSLDGRRLLTVPTLDDATDNTQPAQLWDLANQRRIDTFSVNHLQQAHFSPDSRRLVTNDGTAVARLWNADDGALITFLQPTVRGLAWRQALPSEQPTLVATDSGGTVVTWALASSSAQTMVTHGSYDSRMVLSAHGERLATVSDNNVVTIWDTQHAVPLL
ncbi:MAG: WD40 repeat domain-containing protein, partial [Caldilineaceae bacterium]|nr:WD40 repeat domain-containing protein [Caldilineaceae bacterium]